MSVLVFIVVVFGIYKIKEWLEFEAVRQESEYCAKNGIKHDTNKIIAASSKGLTHSQYRKLYASGALREDKKEDK